MAKSSSVNNRVNNGVAKKGSAWAMPVPKICDETFLENSDFEKVDQIFENKLILDFFDVMNYLHLRLLCALMKE